MNHPDYLGSYAASFSPIPKAIAPDAHLLRLDMLGDLPRLQLAIRQYEASSGPAIAIGIGAVVFLPPRNASRIDACLGRRG